MKYTRFMLGSSVVLVLAVHVTSAAEVVVHADADFMSSGFFAGAPFIRGEGDTRGANAVSVVAPFGVAEETTYFTFDFDFMNFDFTSALGGPVTRAVLQADTVNRSFGNPNPGVGDPFDISAHAVDADPALIDSSLASGPGSWLDFKDNSILDAVATTAVDGEGVFEWDITPLVLQWIDEGDATFPFALAMTGRLDDSGKGFLHSFLNADGPTPGVGPRIVILPEPATAMLMTMGAFGACYFRRGSRRSPRLGDRIRARLGERPFFGG